MTTACFTPPRTRLALVGDAAPARAERHLRLAGEPATTPLGRRSAVKLEDPRDAQRSSGGFRGVHLTRRGRLVVGAAFVLLALVLFSLGRMSAGAAVSPSSLRVTVQSGDSLWSIAQRIAPDADPRSTVSDLAQVNHLSDGAVLLPGDVLVIPRG